MARKAQPSMLEGPIWKGLISFALPILLGNLFQNLYNTVDTLIVGNFIGKEALAAVSSILFLVYYVKADWIHNFDRLDGNR